MNRNWMLALLPWCLVAWLAAGQLSHAADNAADALRKLETRIIPEDASPRDMLYADARERLNAANRADVAQWHEVDGRAAWERFRDRRIRALAGSLGVYPATGQPVRWHVTGAHDGDGYRVENIVFESRPGLWVTAHLYRPRPLAGSMPAIVISHSHHRPKEQGELQDMGAQWARAGCAVLVPDHVGHGERRQHPFADADDFPREFPVSRQDYHFRYNLGMQLALVGDSLMGWMVHDLRRGIDLLLSLSGVDEDRVIVLGAVAGGGDPAAVMAALDERVDCVGPFNFGGPQPESRYPLPEDAEATFRYSGSGSWESTRNLRGTAAGGFMHYVIVGAAAPRHLIYAHEFRWDRERDPVWQRFQTLWGWYGAADRIGGVRGHGGVTLSSAEASHCTNIGPVHREQIHPLLEEWFGIQVADPKFQDRRDTAETLCLRGAEDLDIDNHPVHVLAREVASKRQAAFRQQLEGDGKDLAASRERLRERWAALLGEVDPYTPQVERRETTASKTVRIERVLLRGERGIRVPLVLLSPPRAKDGDGKVPVVVCVAQAGKEKLLDERADPCAELLQAGIAVCLPDLRGCGETAAGSSRGRQSAATSISSTELMLGQTLLGSRLKDVRSVLAWLRLRDDVDPQRIAVWGDSTAAANGPDAVVAVPLGIDEVPHISEPLGGLLALLAPLFEPELAGAAAFRGLVGFESVLESDHCWLPHDVIVPGALTAGDLHDLAAAAACPLLIGPCVNGRNQPVAADTVRETFAKGDETTQPNATPAETARWLIATVRRGRG
jgi:cephalosporin-C deacetylase-like acetyl esterase